MRKARLFVALSLILAALFTSIACGGTQPPKPAGKQGGIFINGQAGGDAETLNWILAADASSSGYASHTVDSLATFNNKLELQLRCLAKDVEISQDGLVYTVTIRDDLKWSNGSQVTAEDYVYTLGNLMFSDWMNYPYKSMWQEEVAGNKVFVTPQVVNATTFTITRQTANPDFVYSIYDLQPYPKYIATKYEGDVKTFTEAPEFNNLTYTGNLGPYRFKEWNRNDKYVVERNPDYYLGRPIGAPYFDQYVIKLFGSSATMQAALEAGDITHCGIEPEKVNKFMGLKNIDVYTVPTTGYTLLAYNQRANGWEGLKKQAIRQALSMSINKETVSQSILLGFGQPAFSFLSPNSPLYDDKSVVKYGVGPLYDKEKAAEILYQEGYGVKQENGTIKATNKDGGLLQLVLVTDQASQASQDIALQVRKELLALGIETRVKLVPWPTLLDQYVRNKVPGSVKEAGYNNGHDAVSAESWDMMLIGLTGGLLSPTSAEVVFTTEGGMNYFGYSNPEVDELFRRLKTKEALDKNMRQQLSSKLSLLLSQDQPFDFVVFQKANQGFQKNVVGIEPGISMWYNYYLWRFE
jgi:peptide/nickel transport system substrate-binding protein